VKAKFFVSLHNNTNISRLAEIPEGRAPQGFFSCCTYLLNSKLIKVLSIKVGVTYFHHQLLGKLKETILELTLHVY
jgi:hypothetical protein